MLLFEGGKSFHIDNDVTDIGVDGAKRVLNSIGMLNSKFKVSKPTKDPVYLLSKSKWQRAKYSGMFKSSIEISSKVEIRRYFGKYYRSLW